VLDAYARPDLYDADHARYDEDVAFYVSRASEARVVLELGAGTGRVTLPMSAAGARVIAVDRSAPMLEVLARRAGGAVETRCEDFCARSWRAATFELAVVANDTLSRCEAPSRVLRALRTAAAPGGRLVFDVYVATAAVRRLDWRPHRREVDVDGRRFTVEERVTWDGVALRTHAAWTNGDERVVLVGASRLVSAGTWRGWLRAAGWEIVAEHADFDGTPARRSDVKRVWTARPRG
jgi:SAM-dependent methyltransferase